MSDDKKRRSPYLVLGVRYGAGKDEAQKAFARSSRLIRRGESVEFDMEDLNWALHAIEQRIEDPSASIDDYRLPANPAAYTVSPTYGVLLADPSGTLLHQVRSQIFSDLLASLATSSIPARALPPINRFV